MNFVFHRDVYVQLFYAVSPLFTQDLPPCHPPVTQASYASYAPRRCGVLRCKTWTLDRVAKTHEGEVLPWQRSFLRSTAAIFSAVP
jgi:hypothetical protein